ncbi:hypothetical protein B7P43_G15999 [Cryptotermes secundus]|uniref:Uncharacterized protein n=1 Tax=Cryptotermes secundus TaxID=105785 RepID=A0A2J7PFG6_9NEOP|nr:hypothetical protein B7P43_G15999 [Cryptotermes secundus]
MATENGEYSWRTSYVNSELKSNVPEPFVSSIMKGHNGQILFFVRPTLNGNQCDL